VTCIEVGIISKSGMRLFYMRACRPTHENSEQSGRTSDLWQSEIAFAMSELREVSEVVSSKCPFSKDLV